jgi:hypothetical protein
MNCWVNKMNEDNRNTKLYRLTENFNENKWLGCVNPEDWKIILKLKWAPMLGSWKPIEVEWIPETANGNPSDLIPFAPGLKVFSKKAFQELSSISDCGEWLDLKGRDGTPFFAFHSLSIHDVFLWNESRIIGDKNHLSNITDMSVRNLGDFKKIFRIPESLNDYIVSSKFFDIVKNYKLSGFIFTEVNIVDT